MDILLDIRGYQLSENQLTPSKIDRKRKDSPEMLNYIDLLEMNILSDLDQIHRVEVQQPVHLVPYNFQ